MAQAMGLCKRCQQFSSELPDMGDGTETRCRMCDGRLGGETVVEAEAYPSALGETKAAKAMLREIRSDGRWQVINGLFFFGVLTSSFIVSMWLWFWGCENLLPKRYGALLTTYGTEEISSYFCMVMVVVTFFVLRAIYRFLGIATPLDDIRGMSSGEELPEHALSPRKRTFVQRLAHIKQELSHAMRHNKKPLLVFFGCFVFPPFAACALMWSELSKDMGFVFILFVPAIIWVGVFFLILFHSSKYVDEFADLADNSYPFWVHHRRAALIRERT